MTQSNFIKKYIYNFPSGNNNSPVFVRVALCLLIYFNNYFNLFYLNSSSVYKSSVCFYFNFKSSSSFSSSESESLSSSSSQSPSSSTYFSIYFSLLSSSY